MEKVTAPRFVRMVKGEQGYGFNLHGEKNLHAGQTISAVDEDTPAHIGGLLVGDRLVEVNETNIESCSHSEVVKKIKAGGNQVTMLVVDPVTDRYLKEQGRPITADMANLTTVFVSNEPLTLEPEPDPVPEPEREAEPVPEPEAVPEAEPVPELAPAVETVEKIESNENVESLPEADIESPPEVAPEVESVPEAVESVESQITPPPEQREEIGENEVDASKKYNLEKAPEATTPEEVKQLNHVLNEENVRSEQVVPAQPAPALAANDNNSNRESLNFEKARQRSIPQRNRVKEKTAESWAEKAKKFQSM